MSVDLHDEVELSIAEHVMLQASFWVYVLPLMGIIVGALLGDAWLVLDAQDGGAMVGALLGFFVPLALIKLNESRLAQSSLYPQLTKVVDSHALRWE